MCFFFFKQKTANEIRISDCSSDVCASDRLDIARERQLQRFRAASERHRLAKSAIESLNAQLTRARMEKEHAYRELRDLMHGRTNVVIGNTLIRFTEGGGVDISACEVVR